MLWSEIYAKDARSVQLFIRSVQHRFVILLLVSERRKIEHGVIYGCLTDAGEDRRNKSDIDNRTHSNLRICVKCGNKWLLLLLLDDHPSTLGKSLDVQIRILDPNQTLSRIFVIKKHTIGHNDFTQF